ncbi:ATP-binding cassette domain-containing protein [Candidatus Woesearchaeota archaeon]|nr:ATP-binding cassette domain-containing protein [Candidatus Woesearchaeota archaeon]
MKPIIRVKNLRKVYKTHKREQGLVNAIKSLVKRQYDIKHALKGVSFEIGKGEIVGLIGPNGAGKSTTIKALSGVLYPTSGLVRVMNYIPWRDRETYVRNLGVVFGQKHQLYWDIPALDTFYLFRDLYDVPEHEFKQRVNAMIKYLDVEEVVKRPVRDLSLGERMKCKIIASLVHNPQLVFLDEPSIGLDVIAKEKLRSFIKAINKKYDTTFIVTTHDMQDIEKLCKRIIIINHGEVVYDGPLEEIRKKYLQNKVLDVKLEEPLKKKFAMKGCKVLKSRRFEIIVEVDTTKQSIRNVIDYMVKNVKFADIIISDPPIEEIIQLIYKEKKE